VSAATGEVGFDPSLTYAVVREESHYRPAVVSAGGANGLIQIIPPTGTEISQAL